MALVGTRPKGLCVRTLFLRTFLLSVILGLWLTELYALEMAETIEQWTKGGRLEGTEKVPLMVNKFIVSCGWTGAPFWLTLTTLLVLILPFVWQFFFSPLNQSKLLEDTEAAPSDLRKRRLRAGNQLPSPYPTGWFCVKVQADEIKPGQIEEIQLFGHTFALYRGWDGKVRMMDAFCTHLGASLAIGGTVQPTSNCLRCPFHGWEFDGSSGRCISIPYGDHGSSQSGEECRPPASSSSSSIKDKVSSSSSSSSSLSSIPKQAHSRAWPVVEAQNMVYVYYDETWARSEDKKSLDEMETEFECPVINELNTPGHDRFVYHGHSVHQVAAHIQEIPENGADVAHLNILHKNFILKALSPLITHIWTADWVAGKRDEGTGHQAFIHLTQKLQCFNGRFDIPGTLIDVTITQDGPGIVYLFFQTPVGRLYVMETVTPISPMVQQATHTMWAERHVPRIVAKIVLWSLVKQFERDIPIWNNKTFLRKPTIVKGDGPITKFRHWYAQFYPDTSLLPPPPACTLDW